ncbi:MAG TPA: hypothetical protein VEW05_28790 [Candidatus Polarisedimenticolia bacterium]|nr:hypothetical protein [Candidatus Polarisedimenticolia bacterium]
MHLCARKSASLARGVASLPRLAVLLVITTVLAYAQTPLTRKPVMTLQNGSAYGYCRVAFSPDGKWLASSGEHGPIILWDAATGIKVRDFGGFSATLSEKLPTGGILGRNIGVGRGGLAFSPDGKYIASSGKSIRDIMNGGSWTGYPPAMWEVATGKPIGDGKWTMGEDHVARARHADFPWATK